MSVSSEQILKIFFNNREETLRIFDTRGPIVSFLANPVNDICPLLGSTITLGKELGKGEGGIIFQIEKDGKNTEYVVKESVLDLLITDNEEEYRQATVDKKLLEAYNPRKNEDNLFYIPIFAVECLLDQELIVADNSDLSYKRKVVFPVGSYICHNEAYSEYILALLAGTFYEKGTSINFIHTFSFATCKSRYGAKNYTFMERIDGTLLSIQYGPRFQDSIEEILIQVLHAISTYQALKISHNDLHFGNIMFQYITPSTTWNGKRLVDYDYFEYIIGETSIYIPRTRLLIKIGDFGLAVKYTHPVVGNLSVVKDGIYSHGYGPWMPNKFSWSYDALVALNNFWLTNRRNLFLSRIFARFLNMTKHGMTAIDRRIDELYNTQIGRPKIHMLCDTKPAEILVDAKLMGKYLEKPRGKKILCIGKF